jgi:hypothetical protein
MASLPHHRVVQVFNRPQLVDDASVDHLAKLITVRSSASRTAVIERTSAKSWNEKMLWKMIMDAR